MERIILSEKNDYWRFYTSSQGFVISLQLNTGTIPEVSHFDTVIDRAGNPHLLLQTGEHLEYYFWTGTRWCAGKKPGVTMFSSFNLALNREGRLQLLLASPLGYATELSYYSLKEIGWQYINTLRKPGYIRVEAFLNWLDNDLAVIYSCNDHGKQGLGLSIYSQGKWQQAAEVLGKGRLLDWCMGAQTMYLLLAKDSLKGGEFSLYNISRQRPQEFVLSAVWNIQGWDGTPLLLTENDRDFKICWQYRGRINIACLQGEPVQLMDHMESDIFYPAEIMSLNIKNTPLRQIVLKTVCGVKLEFPLILDFKDLEAMIKSQGLSGKRTSYSDVHKIYRKIMAARPSRS